MPVDEELIGLAAREERLFLGRVRPARNISGLFDIVNTKTRRKPGEAEKKIEVRVRGD